jgi:4-hydroxy-3-polyprenylbenzoate decarboxylase
VDGVRSVARFPVQVLNQTQVVPHWHRYHAGFQQWQAALRAQKQFPIAIALGGNPVQALVTSTFPVAADSLLLSGFLRGSSLDLVRARSIELDVPAASEIVLEGYVDYSSPLVDAPSIACDTGHYLPAESLPVIQVTAVTHRANPVLPAIIPGAPPSEESWITLATERLSLGVLKTIIPELVDIHRPFCGAGRNLLFVSIRKQHPGQALQVLNALWGSRLLGLHRMIIVVDADIDVQSEPDVWFAVGSNSDGERDFLTSRGPISMDDTTSLQRGVGPKLGIDATRKLSEEIEGRTAPRRMKMSEELIARIGDRWAELGLPGIE